MKALVICLAILSLTGCTTVREPRLATSVVERCETRIYRALRDDGASTLRCAAILDVWQ